MRYQRLKVVFDGPPAPESGRFIEVEREDGSSVSAGKWEELEDGSWALWLRVIDEDVSIMLEKPEKDRGLLKTDADARAFFAFLFGGLFGVFMSIAVPAVMAGIIEIFGLSVR
jgi:hypothetical protein